MDITTLIQMAKEIWCHSRRTVTWLTRMELAWQWSVTTVKTGLMWKDLKTRVATHVSFITKERVCLSWPISPESPHTVSSLYSMTVLDRGCSRVEYLPGGCHVIPLTWRTGVEHHLAVVSSHAGWTTHVQSPVMAVAVIRMTKYGVKTAVFSLKRQSFQ